MYKSYFLKILTLLLLPLQTFAYDFSFQKGDNLLQIDFERNQVKEIKFDLKINGQRNFGIINYHNNEIYILLNTDQISFDNFKKVFPKPQKNKKLSKKINFNWEISEMTISDKYSLFSNKLNFIYDKGFESMMFYDSKKEFELSILPQLDGNKQIYLFSKNAGQFFYAQKISKNMNGGALIRLPVSYSHEKLYKNDNTYDIILVLSYNMQPIKKNRGSAIFIHVAKKYYKKTLGCIAISKISLLKIIKKLNKKSIVEISNQR